MDMIYGLMTTIIICQTMIIIYLWVTRQKPKEYIEGKTIIELKILADSHLSESDKAKLVHNEINQINWDEIEMWQKDAILENILEKIGQNNVILLN